MFKFVVLLASLLSAAAFAPASRMGASSSLKMSFENELGVLPPVGFWDPLGMYETVNLKSRQLYCNPSPMIN